MTHLRILTTLLAILVAVPMTDAAERAYEADEDTLLLAHFEDLKRADYALGNSLFAGIGASQTEGYYGKAIDLRARGLWPNFMETCSDYAPHYDGWGFHARGNVNPAQGTFECFFKPADPKHPKLLWSFNFLNAELGRAVKNPDPEKSNYVGFGITLNSAALRYCLPTVAKNAFMGEIAYRSVKGFSKPLDPQNWHHFALTWSQGEAVIYLDGRPLLSFDMTDQLGLVLLDNPVRYLSMSDCIVDELRISRTVRYASDFEPAWRDGQRPAYAFSGNPDVQRHDPKLFEPAKAEVHPLAAAPADLAQVVLGDWKLGFDKRDGRLVTFSLKDIAAPASANGLLLHRGLERTALKPTGAAGFTTAAGRFSFTQKFEGDIEAQHELRADKGAVLWTVTLSNRGDKEAWLEPLLGLPVPGVPGVPEGKVQEVFDGVEPRRVVHLPRHRDEYCYALPFTAAAYGDRFIGLGIDPATDLSDIVSQWAPTPTGAGVIRQGTKLALSPGESFTYPFHLVAGEGDFATLDAIDAYHARFPELYRLRPDVPVYSYMPMTQHPYAAPYLDIKRVGFAGNIWGHGPGHDKGDEYGNPDWWDNPKFYGRHEYENYTRRIEKLWGSIPNLRQNVALLYQEEFENGYPVRRYHICPDVTPKYIANETWPEYVANEDPLTFGQYYEPTYGWWIVNEYKNPIGAWFIKSLQNYHKGTNGYTQGFINDMSHAGSLYRHNDPIAQKTPGRSFARDLGPFVRKALGRKQRYEVFNNTVEDGFRSSFWSDGGSFSYTLGAYSAGLAIEGAGLYKDLVGSGRYVVPARNLIGEKPFSAMTHENDDWIGYYVKPEEFDSPAALRDYYRYCGAQLVLFCLDNGMTLDPGSYMFGRQFEQEMAPLMVESAVLGRKIVHGARVDEPLWVRRSGNGLGSLLIVGNHMPRAIASDVRVYNRYYGAAPIFAGYFGEQIEQTMAADLTTLEQVTVPAREPVGLKAVGLLRTAGAAKASSSIRGDGISLLVTLDIDSQQGGELLLHHFAPVYDFQRLTLDGKPVQIQGGVVSLPAGAHRLELTARNRAIAFTPEQWEAVELLRDGRTNFQLVADAGITHQVPLGQGARSFRIGYEQGTARLLNDFLAAYDEEDGRLGNLMPARYTSDASGEAPRWSVVLTEDARLPHGRVRIDSAARQVIVEGPTQGEMRRAMVVLLRLVDRKYPHVGRFLTLAWRTAKYDADQPIPFEKWVRRKPTRDFYEKFSDQKFMAKPVLRREYEPLYEDDNMDFTGRYELRVPPFVFEPTYGDDFVYGYSAPGTARPGEPVVRRGGAAPAVGRE